MKVLFSLIAVMLLTSAGFAEERKQPSEMLSPRAAARFLDQATWGSTPATIDALERVGMEDWLKAQFALNTSDLPDQPILDSSGNSNNDLAPVQAAFIQNAVTGADQLRQRVAFAVSEIWVVSATSGVPAAYAYPPYWRIFRDNAFGNYRSLIEAVTLNPAMGRYLNMANNNKGNVAAGTSANENYARELMQLFTLGLTQLQPNGAPVVDQSNNPVPTYTQAIVTQLAKAMTGWTYPTAPGATAKTNNPAYYTGQMFAVAAEHDTTLKAIFDNITIPAGQTAQQDLDSVTNALMAQPTMAPFISEQLIQHLVTSNPSPAYIQRVAQVFGNDGTGVAGNLQAVIGAILMDPEARAADDESAPVNANFGHLREPILFITNLLRGLGATLGASSAIYNNATSMDQELFYAPSVFSYFSAQNRLENGLLGPEFQIYSTQTVANRADIVNAILYGKLDASTTFNLAPFVNAASNTNDLLDYIGFVFLHSSMSAGLRQAAATAVNAATTPTAKAQAALCIVLTSGEYQIIQ